MIKIWHQIATHPVVSREWQVLLKRVGVGFEFGFWVLPFDCFKMLSLFFSLYSNLLEMLLLLLLLLTYVPANEPCNCRRGLAYWQLRTALHTVVAFKMEVHSSRGNRLKFPTCAQLVTDNYSSICCSVRPSVPLSICLSVALSICKPLCLFGQLYIAPSSQLDKRVDIRAFWNTGRDC